MIYRYVTLSKAHLGILKSQLNDIASQWRQQRLGAVSLPVTVEVQEVCRAPTGAPDLDSVAATISFMHESIYCDLDKDSVSGMWRTLTGQTLQARLQSDQLFIMTRTLTLLLDELIARKDAIPKGFAPAEMASKKGSGWCRANLMFGDFTVSLLLPPSVVLSFTGTGLAGGGVSGVTVVPARNAIRNSQLTVTARLGTISVRLRELQQLRVGDVLTVNTQLSEVIKLATASGAYIADARLGVIDGCKGLVLTSSKGNPG